MEWITTSTILRDLRDYANQSAWQGFVFRQPFAQRGQLRRAADKARDSLWHALAEFVLRGIRGIQRVAPYR